MSDLSIGQHLSERLNLTRQVGHGGMSEAWLIDRQP
jgi:hypothetical protein